MIRAGIFTTRARNWLAEVGRCSTTGTTLTHATVQPFLRHADVAAACAGAADLSLLLVDEKPAAFAYCYQYAGYVFGLRTGYDPAVESGGAGTALFARQIRDSFERGDRALDFGAEYIECRPPLDHAAGPELSLHALPRQCVRGLLRFKRWLAGVNHRRRNSRRGNPPPLKSHPLTLIR